LLKVISGGQTGVDRGALDAALELGVECGGWCPPGRLAEDGKIPARYRLREMPVGEYLARTERNVAEADGTLIICCGEPVGGTGETLEFCRATGKPHLIVDCATLRIADAIEQAVAFAEGLSCRASPKTSYLSAAREHRDPLNDASRPLPITILNVAGPRASQWPDGHHIARQIVMKLLRRLSGQASSPD
jgi:hypothetical protein